MSIEPDHTDPSSPTPSWMFTDKGDMGCYQDPKTGKLYPIRGGDSDVINLYPTTDIDLLNLIGFTRPEEQSIILSFAHERDLPLSALLRVGLREYYNRFHPVTPIHPLHQPIGCPDLGD